MECATYALFFIFLTSTSLLDETDRMMQKFADSQHMVRRFQDLTLKFLSNKDFKIIAGQKYIARSVLRMGISTLFLSDVCTSSNSSMTDEDVS